MSPQSHHGTVELRPGYTVLDADGHPVSTATDVQVTLEGGFAHLRFPGTDTVQVVSAPAVARITYRPSGTEDADPPS
ncbi:hypothetical protein AB0K51_21380 [Kitasatospora sp. NPDC049285]|uniref:hypothetical protein n=1 Tax=Kitasatospora sp. NPDC049285 TaxID=3157096 RepID=UPI0034264299